MLLPICYFAFLQTLLCIETLLVMRYYKESPPLLLHPCTGRQVYPVHDGEGDVFSG